GGRLLGSDRARARPSGVERAAPRAAKGADVNEPHVDTALVPYLRGELPADERARVERHLEACESCRGAADDFRLLRERLVATPPPVAEPHWGRYRAELRARLEPSRGRRRAAWLRPVPVAMAAAMLAAVVLTFTVAQRPGSN